MNFGKTDLILLLTMSLAVISMSFVFPALGLTTTDSVNETEIPEFSINASTFDLAGEFPTAPRTPTEGTLSFDSSVPADGSRNRVWLEGDTSGGYELFLSEKNTGTGEVTINEWNSGSVSGSSVGNFSTSNDTFVLVQNEYGVSIEAEKVDSPVYEATYTVTSRPNSGNGVIGSIIGTVGTTAQTLAWFGEIFYWFSISLVEVSLNAIVILFNTISYLIGLVSFLITTYSGIISASKGFASVFLAIPGVILGVTLGKIVFIGIGLLPTT